MPLQPLHSSSGSSYLRVRHQADEVAAITRKELVEATEKKKPALTKSKATSKITSSDLEVGLMESIMHMNEREKMVAGLARRPKLLPNDRNIFHGRVYHYVLPPPVISWSCHQPPRQSKNCPAWLTATEFLDHPDIILDKAQYLARLLRSSRRTVVYSGAGLSTSAGVKQVAWGNTGRGQWKGGDRWSTQPREDGRGHLHLLSGNGRGSTGRREGLGRTSNAAPTTAHLALASLVKMGLIQEWVQLSHDGLPQKAGCPQELMNEVRGSWFDPSNPVVRRSGSFRQDLQQRLESGAEEADLVLAVGTSLCGVNTDTVASIPAQKSLQGKCLGVVIINLQQTPLDPLATLRIFSPTDQIMAAVLKILHIKVERGISSAMVEHSALVPYDHQGTRSYTKLTLLNLNSGQRIRLNSNHNSLGCGQASRLHISEAGVGGKKTYAVGRVVRYCSLQRAWQLEVEGVNMMLGAWWMEAAKRGVPQTLPVVNFRTCPQQREGKNDLPRVAVRTSPRKKHIQVVDPSQNDLPSLNIKTDLQENDKKGLDPQIKEEQNDLPLVQVVDPDWKVEKRREKDDIDEDLMADPDWKVEKRREKDNIGEDPVKEGGEDNLPAINPGDCSQSDTCAINRIMRASNKINFETL